jgi:hypothetical protein
MQLSCEGRRLLGLGTWMWGTLFIEKTPCHLCHASNKIRTTELVFGRLRFAMTSSKSVATVQSIFYSHPSQVGLIHRVILASASAAPMCATPDLHRYLHRFDTTHHLISTQDSVEESGGSGASADGWDGSHRRVEKAGWISWSMPTVAFLLWTLPGFVMLCPPGKLIDSPIWNANVLNLSLARTCALCCVSFAYLFCLLPKESRKWEYGEARCSFLEFRNKETNWSWMLKWIYVSFERNLYTDNKQITREEAEFSMLLHKRFLLREDQEAGHHSFPWQGLPKHVTVTCDLSRGPPCVPLLSNHPFGLVRHLPPLPTALSTSSDLADDESLLKTLTLTWLWAAVGTVGANLPPNSVVAPPTCIVTAPPLVTRTAARTQRWTPFHNLWVVQSDQE